MFARLAQFVVRQWLLVVVFWLLAMTIVRWYAPSWDSIAHDGDFAYLPAQMPSVVGEQWMSQAFPRQRGRSQVVVAIVRPDAVLNRDDIHVAYDVARRMLNLLGAARLAAAQRLAEQPAAGAPGRPVREADVQPPDGEFVRAVQQTREALEHALELDKLVADYWNDRVEREPGAGQTRPPRLAEIYHNLSLLDQLTGDATSAAEHARLAAAIDPALGESAPGVLPAGAEAMALVDVWSWEGEYFESRLRSADNRVRLVVLQLTNEFMAVDNIAALRLIEAELATIRDHLPDWTAAGLSVVQSGSAAVGADLLRSAASSIQHTELFTVVLVVLILVLVYRSPLLVALPVITIIVSLLTSMGIVALLSELGNVPGFDWWTFKVFSTTRIFIVVILFGAGTDYCLFLIARYQEELQAGVSNEQAVARALAQVGDALAASALTTILGLGMMFFAEFGKFRYSGPVIGLCLAVTLLTCTTLTPALMRGVGPVLFWPLGVGERAPHELPNRRGVWCWLAEAITARPATILVVAVGVLVPVAGYGVAHRGDVTYDFLSGLPMQCLSKQGAETLRAHFPVGESGPVTVLVHQPAAQLESRAGREQIRTLADQLYLPGVQAVRSREDPLGYCSPGERPGLASEKGRQLVFARQHPLTKSIFVPQSAQLADSLARFELILDCDPFSLRAVQVLDRVETRLHELSQQPQSFWSNARFALAGTTAAIRDLRAVTQRDNWRIQLLVVLAVFVVLLLLLRRVVVCSYMMLTVLFSYYLTIGIATLFFSWAYGTTYQGLDWKVPLFLFVILVAVGQDYNVYLATRVFEEQERLGPLDGLRFAVVRTGGIITSCGVIMAGTFLSMTSGTWGHWLPVIPSSWTPPVGTLRSIVELGFALAVGVILDTFVVRPILVPAFLALLCRQPKQCRQTDTVPGK